MKFAIGYILGFLSLPAFLSLIDLCEYVFRRRAGLWVKR